ncbi:MAG: cytochrome c3 family protein [Desulfobacteria bacterium]
MSTRHDRWSVLPAAVLMVGLLLLPTGLPAQEEVASAIRRYRDREVSTGFYEEYEAKPLRQRPLISIPGVRPGPFPYSPVAARVRIRTRLADSHQGIKFYKDLRCQDCHIKETRDIHTVRGNLTCRQCHGGEPIASLEHYYSPFNPIRRHAYVCAKCHEGSSASFATYVVHAPNPAMATTRKTFPVLFYVFWGMIALAGGTFVVFLPHTVMWGFRELFMKKDEAEGESERKE